MSSIVWSRFLVAFGVVVAMPAPAADYVPVQRLFAPEVVAGRPAEADGERYGASVAVDGALAVVGAPDDRFGTQAARGAVHAYARVDGRWRHEAVFRRAAGGAADRFGTAVSLSGRYTAVHAAGGTVTVFERVSAGAWVERATVALAAGQVAASGAVAIDGDRLAIGVRRADGVGTVNVYQRVGDAWTLSATVVPGFADAESAQSVALSGDRLVVGSPDNALGQGRVEIFVRDATGWVNRVSFAPGRPVSSFGASVAIRGDTLVLSAPEPEDGGFGSVYVLRYAGGLDWDTVVSDDADAARTGLGTSIAIGADGGDVFATDAGGRIHRYVREADGGYARAGIVDEAGGILAATGDTLMAGRPADIVGGATVGSVRVFAQGDAAATPAIAFTLADGTAIAPGRQLEIVDTIDGAPTALMVRIGNTGGAPLSAIAALPLPAPLAVSVSGTSVAPGGAPVIATVTCNATSEGTVATGLTIVSDDPDAVDNPATFPLRCIGVAPSADLGITIDNGRTAVVRGDTVRYRVTVVGNGTAIATAARITVPLPVGVASATWACTVVRQASCPSAAGTGAIDLTTTLGPTSIIDFVIDATIARDAAGFVDYVARVDDATLPDPVTTNDVASDRDPVATDGVFANGFEDPPTTRDALLSGAVPSSD